MIVGHMRCPGHARAPWPSGRTLPGFSPEKDSSRAFAPPRLLRYLPRSICVLLGPQSRWCQTHSVQVSSNHTSAAACPSPEEELELARCTSRHLGDEFGTATSTVVAQQSAPVVGGDGIIVGTQGVLVGSFKAIFQAQERSFKTKLLSQSHRPVRSFAPVPVRYRHRYDLSKKRERSFKAMGAGRPKGAKDKQKRTRSLDSASSKARKKAAQQAAGERSKAAMLAAIRSAAPGSSGSSAGPSNSGGQQGGTSAAAAPRDDGSGSDDEESVDESASESAAANAQPAPHCAVLHVVGSTGTLL